MGILALLKQEMIATKEVMVCEDKKTHKSNVLFKHEMMAEGTKRTIISRTRMPTAFWT